MGLSCTTWTPAFALAIDYDVGRVTDTTYDDGWSSDDDGGVEDSWVSRRWRCRLSLTASQCDASSRRRASKECWARRTTPILKHHEQGDHLLCYSISVTVNQETRSLPDGDCIGHSSWDKTTDSLRTLVDTKTQFNQRLWLFSSDLKRWSRDSSQALKSFPFLFVIHSFFS